MNAYFKHFLGTAVVLFTIVFCPIAQAEVRTNARSFSDRTGFEITLTADPSDIRLMVWSNPDRIQAGVTIMIEGGFHLFAPVTTEEAYDQWMTGSNEGPFASSDTWRRAAERKMTEMQARLQKFRASGSQAQFRSYVNQNSVINGVLLQKRLVVNGMEAQRH